MVFQIGGPLKHVVIRTGFTISRIMEELNTPGSRSYSDS